MTQAEVIVHLAHKLGIRKKIAGQLLDELNALVVSELNEEGSIRLGGVGTFRKRVTEARVGRNPATGEQIRIPARTYLRFTFAKALKELVLDDAEAPNLQDGLIHARLNSCRESLFQSRRNTGNGGGSDC